MIGFRLQVIALLAWWLTAMLAAQESRPVGEGGDDSSPESPIPEADQWYYDRIAGEGEVERGGLPEAHWLESWHGELGRIRERLETIDRRLAELPRRRFEVQGDRSTQYALWRVLEDDASWLGWTVPEPVEVDAIHLLPTRAPQSDGTALEVGFPRDWHIETSESGAFEDAARLTVPDRDADSDAGFPVRVDVGRTLRSWRLVVERPYDGYGIPYLSLSECFVISGDENVAGSGTFSWSENLLPDRTMAPAFLSDGHTWLGLPLIREATNRLGYHSEITAIVEGHDEWIELEWESPVALREIRLVPAQQRVLPHTETFGFPREHETTFWLGEELIGKAVSRFQSDPGQNIVRVNPPGAAARVTRVRWTARELWQRRESVLLALAEIEAVDREGRNRAPEAAVRVRSSIDRPTLWHREMLTDGLASEGPLLPVGEWLARLDESRRLVGERDALLRERADRIRRGERWTVAGLATLPVAMTALLGLLWWRERRGRIRRHREIQEQMAADLHDDLGGNLGSIALLADQAAEDEGRAEVRDDLRRVVSLARESRTRLRQIVTMAGAGPDHDHDLEAETFSRRLELLARDFLPGVVYRNELGEGSVDALRGMSRRDLSGLYLFCKEWMHNLQQHGSAERAAIRISREDDAPALELRDDGVVALQGTEVASRSLRRRARGLGGRLHAKRETAPSGKEENVLALKLPSRSGSKSS